MVQASAAIVSSIVEFCRFARERGLSAGVKESVEAVRAAEAVGIEDVGLLRNALRTVLCSSKLEWDLFDELFNEFWRSQSSQIPKHGRKPSRQARQSRSPQNSASLLIGGTDSRPAEEDGGKAVLGAAAHERLKKTDFSQITSTDQEELEKISRRLLRQMSLRLSRRLKLMRLGGRVDLRRTIRQNISRGGELLELSFRGRKRQQQRLVILLDISGSMNAYSLFLLRFVYALQKHFRRVDAFLFSTQLTEITTAMRKRELKAALNTLSEEAAGWSGGTKIGESLADFNLHHSSGALSRDTVFIILSDGWDTGEPAVLAAELAAIRRRVSKLIWLNPLLGMHDYEPVTRGMAAALPHIDVFAPAHNLESLLQLERHLARG